MMKLRFWIALFCAKCTMGFMHLVKRNATYFPGKLALKLCPDFLKYVARPDKIIAVTGTNGKTTVSNLIVDIFTAKGEKVVDNRMGSNIAAGIASSLIGSATFGNRCTATLGVLEVDERSSIRVYPYIKPDYAIITNLFRDSINRNAHPAFIASFIDSYMPASTKMILDGNDLLTVGIQKQNPRAYFGVELLEGETGTCDSRMNDLTLCPNCRSKLVYDWQHYHHIGKAHCPDCGLRSPDCEYNVLSFDKAAGMMTLSFKGETVTMKAPGGNLSDIYNGAAVAALLGEMGMSAGEAARAMGAVTVMASRYKTLQAADGVRVVCQMAKDLNAIACSRAFDIVRRTPGKKEVVLMMYNRELVAGSSENIAWIYDSDFEFLAGDDISRIVVAGPRAADFCLRLLLAGVKEEKLVTIPHERYATDKLNYEANESVFILYGTDSIKEAMELQEDIVRYVNNGRKAAEA